MSQTKISAFEKGLAFEGFLLVRSARQRTSNNGNNYLDMTLGDNTGDINARCGTLSLRRRTAASCSRCGLPSPNTTAGCS